LIHTIGPQYEESPEEALLEGAFVLLVHGPAKVKMKAEEERGKPVDESVNDSAGS
jgi:hypothetical protein